MWDIVGQEKAVTFLQKSLARGSLAHAYLLVGPPHVGKMALAVNIAMAINCELPEPPCGKCASCQRIAAGKQADIQIIELGRIAESADSESKTKISVEQVDQILHAVNLAPYEGKFRVFIIDGVEYMSIAAANRLLKTIEEPVKNVIFVLLTANESLVPITIVSRCQRIELLPVSAEVIENALISRHQVEPEKARLLALNAWRETFGSDYDRRFAFAAKLVEKHSQNRSVVQQKLDLLLSWWHDLLLAKVGCADDIKNIDFQNELKTTAAGYSLGQIRAFIGRIQSAKEQLRSNTNPQLVIEVMMLNMPEKNTAEKLVA